MASDAIPRITRKDLNAENCPHYFTRGERRFSVKRSYLQISRVSTGLARVRKREYRDKQLAFGNNLIDIARNHLEGNMCLGDMLDSCRSRLALCSKIPSVSD